jgi:hypothetical protein
VLVKGSRASFECWRNDILRALTTEVMPFQRDCLDHVGAAIDNLLRRSEQAN